MNPRTFRRVVITVLVIFCALFAYDTISVIALNTEHSQLCNALTLDSGASAAAIAGC